MEFLLFLGRESIILANNHFIYKIMDMLDPTLTPEEQRQAQPVNEAPAEAAAIPKRP